jgi:hypothetical protein
MMGRQARASVLVMRLWKPHDPGRSCLHFTIRHHLTNQTEPQNEEPCPDPVVGGVDALILSTDNAMT